MQTEGAAAPVIERTHKIDPFAQNENARLLNFSTIKQNIEEARIRGSLPIQDSSLQVFGIFLQNYCIKDTR